MVTNFKMEIVLNLKSTSVRNSMAEFVRAKVRQFTERGISEMLITSSA